MSDEEWKDWVSNEIPYQQTCPGNLAAGEQKPH